MYKKSQMRCDPPHQRQICWVLAAFNGCKWVFLHFNAWHPIFPHKRKHMDPIQSLSYCFIYMIVSCLFSPLTHSTCLAHFDNVEIKKLCLLRGCEITTLCKTFSHPLCWITPPRYIISMKQQRLPFPLSPLYSNGPGLFSFFFLATRHKVIKS